MVLKSFNQHHRPERPEVLLSGLNNTNYLSFPALSESLFPTRFRKFRKHFGFLGVSVVFLSLYLVNVYFRYVSVNLRKFLDLCLILTSVLSEGLFQTRFRYLQKHFGFRRFLFLSYLIAFLPLVLISRLHWISVDSLNRKTTKNYSYKLRKCFL